VQQTSVQDQKEIVEVNTENARDSKLHYEEAFAAFRADVAIVGFRISTCLRPQMEVSVPSAIPRP